MRYKVFYGADEARDFAICYADSKKEALEQFRRYHAYETARVTHIEEDPIPDVTSLRELAGEADEHEFLIDLIGAIEDLGLEDKIAECLHVNYAYGR